MAASPLMAADALNLRLPLSSSSTTSSMISCCFLKTARAHTVHAGRQISAVLPHHWLFGDEAIVLVSEKFATATCRLKLRDQ